MTTPDHIFVTPAWARTFDEKTDPVEREYVRRDPAVLAELPEVRDQWQPIETAPKDGTQVLCCSLGADDRPMIFVGHWAHVPTMFSSIHIEPGPDGWAWVCGFSAILQPTHWMPLPAPPAAIREGRNG